MKVNFMSEEIPHKIIKWGKVIIVFSSITIFIIVFLLRYPEKIYGSAIITTKNPPIKLFPKISGEIDTLYFNEGDIVEKNDILGVINGLGDYKDVMFLDKYLKTNSIVNIENILERESLNLGALQTHFLNFINDFNNARRNEDEKYTDSKITNLKKEIYQVNSSNGRLLENKRTMSKELILAENSFNRYKILHKKGVISDLDFEKNELSYLQQKRKLEDITILIYNNRIKVNQLENQIVNLKENKSDESYFSSVKTKESYKILMKEIQDWKDKYLILSPISGVVSMTERRVVNQYVLSSQPFCVIIPNDSEIIALGALPIARFGKLQENSSVIIKLENYPSKEFGVLEGEIKNISLLINNNNNYSLEINLPKKLKTSYGLDIKYTPELKGRLEVVLEKRSLFEKLIYEIKDRLFNS